MPPWVWPALAVWLCAVGLWATWLALTPPRTP
jgi:hypothetical protein